GRFQLLPRRSPLSASRCEGSWHDNYAQSFPNAGSYSVLGSACPISRDNVIEHPTFLDEQQPRDTMIERLRCYTLLAVVMFVALHSPARADNYPSKSLTIVVSLAAGTGMDAVARLYADRLSLAL